MPTADRSVSEAPDVLPRARDQRGPVGEVEQHSRSLPSTVANYLTKSYKYLRFGSMSKGRDHVPEAEHALEQLFRLTMNRKVHTKQSAAVGADVTRAGYAVLRYVDEAGEPSLGEIARECSMDPAAVGRQVKVLEDDGFVERYATNDDGRVTVVRLTRAGRDVYRRIVEVRLAYMGDVLADWSATDRATLARLVDRLVDDLKAVRFRPTPARGVRR
jgi:DNA-binding MarR family transcriptional regulator